MEFCSQYGYYCSDLSDFCQSLVYYLSDQMNRACLSIVLNIAEGSAKKSNKDFNRYLQHSLGSATELTAALDVAKEFALLGEKEYLEIIDLISSVIKQL